MARDEKALASTELAEALKALASVQGRRRLDAILDARDPGALIRALPAEDLYFTIREIGIADAAPLVPLASLDQFRTFLDLDAWRGDQLDPHRALTWLRAARSGSQQDPRAAARWRRKLSGIDQELLYFILRETLVIHDLDEEPDPEIHGDRAQRSPDGYFLIEFLPEGAEFSALRGILDDLYAEDSFQATRLLSSLRLDSPSELEETALRWRTARLADLGIPPLEEALSWFARPPRAAARTAAPGAPAQPPGFYLAALASGSLLDLGMAALAAEDRPGVEGQIVAAANASLVADQVDVADADAVRTAFQSARAVLELGLEARLRADGRGLDGSAAAEVLAEVPVKRLFQEGFGRILELRFRAERIVKAGGAGTREAPLLDAPLGEALFALSSRRPRYFPGLEARREEWASPSAGAFAPRAFLSSAELARTAAALDGCEWLAKLARDLGLAVSASGPQAPRLTALYLTALANERMGRSFAPEPLAVAELPAAIRSLSAIDDPRLAGAGQAGALLLELARARAGELRKLLEAGEAGPGRTVDLVVRAPA
jgi:hypothetical protein